MKKGNSFTRKLKYHYLKFKRLSGSPHSLAGGTAIGVLVGLTPTVPFHTPLIIIFSLLSKTSIVAGLIASWLVFNPLTILPIYYVSVLVGNFLTPYEINFTRLQVVIDKISIDHSLLESFRMLISLGYETMVVLFVGGFVFSLPFSLVSYYCALTFFTQRQSKKARLY